MAAGRRTRILIVDDSAVMRSLLRSVVCADAGLEVAGTAADGASALDSIATLHPDLILLDVEMPVMDGLVTLKQLRARGHKMPVIMCSSLTQRGAKVTIEALAGGASDYVAKPAGQAEPRGSHAGAGPGSDSEDSCADRVHTQIGQPQPAIARHAACAADAARWRPGTRRSRYRPSRRCWPSASPRAVRRHLTFCCRRFLTNFPLPVLIVQHMPELFTGLFAERLNGRCRLRVREAAEGDPVCAGTIYIARGNWHMEVLAAARAGMPATLHLNQGPLENHCRPAVDVLFRIRGSGLWQLACWRWCSPAWVQTD